MAAATAFDALDGSQPRASQCGYSLMNLWCGLSPLLAKTYRRSRLRGTSGKASASDIASKISTSFQTPDVAGVGNLIGHLKCRRAGFCATINLLRLLEQGEKSYAKVQN